ncbi:MAG TPA: YggT family protein [Clostridiales bacterium]|nr:YggT family protein [Clostridiales bacterium]HPV01990.1 YggT family protein [Clostridiales bacterium]
MRFFLYRLASLFFDAAELILLIRVVISWLPVNRDHRLVILLYRITEPILMPIRSMIRRSSVGNRLFFDFSPLIAFILLAILRNIVLRIILRFI